MVTQMTNKLLATVMAFAVSTGLAAHAAQDPQRALPQVNLAKITLPKATSVPPAGPAGATDTQPARGVSQPPRAPNPAAGARPGVRRSVGARVRPGGWRGGPCAALASGGWVRAGHVLWRCADALRHRGAGRR